MKGLIKTSLLFVVLFATLTVNAKELVKKVKNTANVSFKDVKKGNTLLIKEENGLILYKEKISKNGDYSKEFDLTALPNGSYFFELNKDVVITVIPFSVSSNEIKFDKAKETNIFKPLAYVKGSMVYISKGTIKNNDVVLVNFYRGTESIFKDKIKISDGILGRIYDFSALPKGTYSVIMFTNSRSFKQHINI